MAEDAPLVHFQTPSLSETQSIAADIRAFLNEHYAGQHGYYWLGYIEGDPAIEQMREEWYDLPRQARTITARYVKLAERGYNLYCTPCLFSTCQRIYTNALPSPWLWLDDTAIDGAKLVETSKDNFQSWLKLDQLLSAKERSVIQRAIRDSSNGADLCSADAVHPARLPGGWNCKRHGIFRVRVARPTEHVFRVDDLRERFPQAIQQEGQIADAEGANWSDLPNGAMLANSARFRRLREANPQLHAVCSGEAIALRMKNGRMDASISNQRAVFVNQLLRAKYPHNEIRALAKHFQDVLESNSKWFTTDIDRLLRPVVDGGYVPNDYKPEATRCTIEVKEAPRGGRHYELTVGDLLDLYHECADCGPRGIVLDWTINDAAEHMQVSHGTIKRREAEAIAAGLMRREYGRVVLSPTTWEMGSQRIETAQIINDSLVKPIGSQRIGLAQTMHGDASGAIKSESIVPIGSQRIALPQTVSDGSLAPTGSETIGADAGAEYPLAHAQCEERACGESEITHHPLSRTYPHSPFTTQEARHAPIRAAELQVLNESAGYADDAQSITPTAGARGGVCSFGSGRHGSVISGAY